MYYLPKNNHQVETISNPAVSCIGFRPDGTPVSDFSELPENPEPTLVIIAPTHIEINGWHFPHCLITRGFLKWLQKTVTSWVKADQTAATRQWAEGLISAYQDSLTRRPQPTRWQLGEPDGGGHS